MCDSPASTPPPPLHWTPLSVWGPPRRTPSDLALNLSKKKQDKIRRQVAGWQGERKRLDDDGEAEGSEAEEVAGGPGFDVALPMCREPTWAASCWRWGFDLVLRGMKPGTLPLPPNPRR